VASKETLVGDVLSRADEVQASSWLDLEPTPRAPGSARRFVQSNAPALTPETEDSLILLTSELVTNAVLHARTAISVGLVVAKRSVLVLVHDLDLTQPSQNPYPQREGGWGLALVGALAESSGMAIHPGGGKTAWFRLLRQPAPYVADDAAARPDASRRDS
jgi:two-component sensor histidine kinase